MCAGSKTKGRPRPVRGLGGEAGGTGDFAPLRDTWTSEAWPDWLVSKWPSGPDLKGPSGTVEFARGRRSSLAGDGYVDVLNGGGREPLGLAGRSLRRLER